MYRGYVMMEMRLQAKGSQGLLGPSKSLEEAMKDSSPKT